MGRRLTPFPVSWQSESATTPQGGLVENSNAVALLASTQIRISKLEIGNNTK